MRFFRRPKSTFARDLTAREERWLERTRNLIGVEADRMLNDPMLAIENLSHPEGRVRLAAIDILCDHHNSRDAMKDTWITMSRSDVDPLVRNQATFTLAKCYEETNPNRAKRMLAELIKYSPMHAETQIVMFAYLMNITRTQLLAELQAGPEKIDWTVIDEILSSPDAEMGV